MPNVSSTEGQSSSVEREQEQLGLRLKEAREYLGLSQEFVADQLQIPRASVSAMEAGKRKVSSLELKQLARLYKTTVAQLLRTDDESAEGDETVLALFRTTKELGEDDREQVLRFAQFLKSAGKAPSRSR